MPRQLFEVPRQFAATIKIIQVLGFGTFVVYAGLSLFYSFTLSTHPDAADRDTYPLYLHGHVVYLDYVQHIQLKITGTLTTLFGAAFGLLWVHLFLRHRAATSGSGDED